jgi:hypothetical protein
MDILMQMEAFAAAEEIYLHGKHAGTSLAALATDSGLDVLPQYTLFASLFDSVTYADDFVHGALVGSDEKLTASQRRSSVLRFSQLLVLQHAALQEIFDSASRCSTKFETNNTGLMDSWDNAAAILIGSIDRSTLGEFNTWHYTPYDLAQEHCSQFGTCSKEGIADSNKKMIELLYAGRGAVAGGSCGAMYKIGEELRSLLLIPVIQATLSSSLKLSLSNHTKEDITEAYVSSQVLLPLVKEVDSSAAASIEDILVLHAGDTHFRKTTGPAIFAIFAGVYEDMGVDCELVGTAHGHKACDYEFAMASTESLKIAPGSLTGILCMVLGILIILAVYFRNRKSKKKMNPEFTNLSVGLLGLPREEVINMSYKAKKKRVSPKAARALSRIMRYGDDEIEIGKDGKRSLEEEEGATDLITNVKHADMI